MENIKEKLSIDLDDNIVKKDKSLNELAEIDKILADQKNPSKDELEDLIDRDLTFTAKPGSVSQQKNYWLKPITKKRFVVKLIPFMIVCLLILALFAVCFIIPSINTSLSQSTKLSLYLLAPILLVVFSPFAFYLFDRPYCQYNLNHNEKMKKLLAKFFIKPVSQNGCFRLKEIYLENPNQLAWLMNANVIIFNYKKWNPTAYFEDIEAYKKELI